METNFHYHGELADKSDDNDMEFRKIVYFLKVSEKLNFRKAAQELFISSQALSQQIKELEATLGFALFIRSTTEVKLTEAGAAMQQRFAPLLEQWMRAWNETISEKRVRLAYFSGLPQGDIISRVIKYFADHHSDWQLELLGQELSDVRNLLLDNQVDLALTNCHTGEIWDGCQIHSLLTVPACLIFSKTHPMAQKDEVTTEDIRQLDFIFLKQKLSLKTPDIPGSFYRRIAPEHIRYTDDNTSLRQLIGLGKGTCALPLWSTSLSHEGIELVAKPLPEEWSFDFNVSLIYKQDHLLRTAFNSAARELKSLL